MNLGQVLFLHDLITDKEINICSHIFHTLSKTAKATEYPYPKQSSINIRTLNASINHSQRGVKQKSHAPHSGSRSTSHSYDEKLDTIMAFVQDINTKMSGLASIISS